MSTADLILTKWGKYRDGEISLIEKVYQENEPDVKLLDFFVFFFKKFFKMF